MPVQLRYFIMAAVRSRGRYRRVFKSFFYQYLLMKWYATYPSPITTGMAITTVTTTSNSINVVPLVFVILFFSFYFKMVRSSGYDPETSL